jgi:hypothetical protein
MDSSMTPATALASIVSPPIPARTRVFLNCARCGKRFLSLVVIPDAPDFYEIHCISCLDKLHSIPTQHVGWWIVEAISAENRVWESQRWERFL